MKRFRFPLQPVAVLRAHHELRAQQAFAAAVQAFNRADEALRMTRARVAQFEASLAAGRRERFSGSQQAEALAAYATERTAEAESERIMLAAQSAMNERRNEYLEAHRKVEVVKRLEAKARMAHRLGAAKEEQAEFDDYATRRFRTRRALISV
jgi:flagellar FliJ protein